MLWLKRIVLGLVGLAALIACILGILAIVTNLPGEEKTPAGIRRDVCRSVRHSQRTRYRFLLGVENCGHAARHARKENPAHPGHLSPLFSEWASPVRTRRTSVRGAVRPASLGITGQAVPVLDGVKTSPNRGAADFAVSDTGALVYLPENAFTHDGLIVWVDRKKQVKELAAPARHYGSPHISPDGQRIAVTIPSGGSGSDVLGV
jgi:hypothetical protein